MKTLLFTLEYPPFKGGVANVYGHIVKYWPKPEELAVLENGKNKLIKSWLRPRWLSAVFRLDRAVARNRIEHVLVGHILPLGLVVRIVGKWRRRLRYSVFMHGMDFEYAHKSGRKSRQSRRILSGSTAVICSNSFLALRVRERYPEIADRVRIVNPGIEADTRLDPERVAAVRARFNLANKIVFLSLGRLVRRKGVDIALQAFAEIVKRVPSAYYVIAGDGPDKEYLKECAAGIPNVIFTSQVDEDLKWALLNLCDIFVMPSRDIDGDYEGFGIVYLEAALCGKPVIAGDSGGVRDAVSGARTGILIDGAKVERVAGAMLALLQDKDLRNKMGAAGRERALSQFQWPDKTKEVYEAIK